MSVEPTLQEVLSDLARAKAVFQLRAVEAVLGFPASTRKEVAPCTPRK